MLERARKQRGSRCCAIIDRRTGARLANHPPLEARTCTHQPTHSGTMASVLLAPDFQGDFSIPIASLCSEIERSPEKYANHRLVNIHHYKEKTLVGHEFLIIEIFDGKYTPYQLRIERRPTRKKPNRLSLLRSEVYVRITDDVISRVSATFKPVEFYHIATSRCHPTPSSPMLTLPEVCKILKEIRNQAPNYSLLEYMCYWFCVAFLCGVEDLRVKVVKKNGKDYRLQGKFSAGTGEGVKFMDQEWAAKDFERYKAKMKEVREQRESDERKAIRDAFVDTVQMRKAERVKGTVETREAVKPLLQTSEARREAEAQDLRSAFSWIVAATKNRSHSMTLKNVEGEHVT
ncbi:hypothetical protein BV22DRAFT_851362 [Leucogyrophana mollusca]|uniref:Uncharacterized protein n=1 Tax=Leucogyrophana mollusca TaxID=85980 RepID=A0ACB8B450_9AGAM|nr:hypothetical protein BV22DRAFT_851362 [Leucogyrophana mollusca]